MKIIFLLVSVTLLLGSCSKEPKYKKKNYNERTMNTMSSGADLPISLWSELEAVPGLKAKQEPWPTKFFGIKVFLSEKNHGILGGINHELIYGDGGGELDLADFATAKNGSFYIAIEPQMVIKPDSPEPDRHVYYLSNAVKRQLGNESVGAGCNTYYEITTFFEKAMSGEGIQVNTTAGRHVSALAGTYIFAIPYENHLYLAQLTIKDSRLRALQCRR